MAKAKGESKMRKTGILMPVSSLPSRTGVGEMGAEAYHFLTLLKRKRCEDLADFADESGGIRKLPVSAIFFLVQGMSYISVWIRCMRKGC